MTVTNLDHGSELRVFKPAKSELLKVAVSWGGRNPGALDLVSTGVKCITPLDNYLVALGAKFCTG